ncbi:hypothetical protein HELRODRAFT_170979 [Helobdella robusta]|uniref:Uncharacterized protein n=1 Tax=Helobdella robusta TaxID=6412 RepID=T1F3N6_HELRO|nr:hypothetical protein HELRODRAFT_170979 [Helobdella robusta]ESO06943.1 hypothetical protein HELRODRAFT_170979 [Helobdella robusta]
MKELLGSDCSYEHSDEKTTNTTQTTHFEFRDCQESYKNNEKQSNAEDLQCICDRPEQIVLCKLCSYELKGRVRKRCIVHPTTVYVMDISCCPQCHSKKQLVEVIPF